MSGGPPQPPQGRAPDPVTSEGAAATHPRMDWFTHYTRPARKGLAPGGRNHVRRDAGRTLCGLGVDPWIARPFLIMDPLSGDRAYPDCKRCARLLVAARPPAHARAA